MAYSEGDSGISAAKESAASKQLSPTSEFLTGPQSSSVIGSLTGLKEAAARKTAAAGARPDQIRAAAREANALQLAQVARQASIAKQGIATGGGVGRAGGSTALDLMRQASAASVTAEERAGQAAVEAAEAEKEESQLGTDLAMFEAEMVAGQQKQIGAFVEDLSLTIDSMLGAGQGYDDMAAYVTTKLGTLDLNDPAQQKAAAGALSWWAAYKNIQATPEVSLAAIKLFGPSVAQMLNEDPDAFKKLNTIAGVVKKWEQAHGAGAKPPGGWGEAFAEWGTWENGMDLDEVQDWIVELVPWLPAAGQLGGSVGVQDAIFGAFSTEPTPTFNTAPVV